MYIITFEYLIQICRLLLPVIHYDLVYMFSFILQFLLLLIFVSLAQASQYLS